MDPATGSWFTDSPLGDFCNKSDITGADAMGNFDEVRTAFTIKDASLACAIRSALGTNTRCLRQNRMAAVEPSSVTLADGRRTRSAADQCTVGLLDAFPDLGLLEEIVARRARAWFRRVVGGATPEHCGQIRIAGKPVGPR